MSEGRGGTGGTGRDAMGWHGHGAGMIMKAGGIVGWNGGWGRRGWGVTWGGEGVV